MTIRHWEGVGIDDALIDHLLTSALHCPPKVGLTSGLVKAYRRFKRGMRFITHVWVAYSEEGAIGVAMLEDNPDTCVQSYILQVYVKDAHRGKGIGHQLVAEAVATGEVFGAYYTATSSGLYQRFGLANLKHEPITIYDLAS